MSTQSRIAVVVVPLLAAFLLIQQGVRLGVTQDDAYITFVYSKHLVTGEGLTFNPGERVEGYTNFLWVLIMAVPHLFDADIPRFADLLALICALTTILVLYQWGRHLQPERTPVLSLVAPLLFATNGAVAFWTFSGMETALFTFLLTSGFVLYFRDLRCGSGNMLTASVFGLAALTRPEGLLAFGLTVVHSLALQRPFTLASLAQRLRWTTAFFAFVLPHFAFRFAYYGEILPNTFFAKSAPPAIALQYGAQYTWEFLAACGLWGLTMLGPWFLLWRGQAHWGGFAVLVLWVYTGYITVMGGDVLGAHRFYVPLLPLFYLVIQESIVTLVRVLFARWHTFLNVNSPVFVTAVYLTTGGVAWHTYTGLDEALVGLRQLIISHNDKLRGLAAYINDRPDADTMVVASGAIGIPKYFTSARVIDLIGLTDATVAHSEERLAGLDSPSILRRQHTQYVMDEKPDLFFFVTGVKPQTIAEKALFLSRRFRQQYYMTYLKDDLPAYARRHQAAVVAEERYPDPSFIAAYAEGLSYLGRDWILSRQAFDACLETAPNDFAYHWQYLGQIALQHNDTKNARVHFERAVAIDDHCVKALSYLALLDIKNGHRIDALRRARRALELAPGSMLNRFVFGLAALANGLTEEALESMRLVAQDEGPNRIEARFFIGLAHKIMGQHREAREAWEAVLRKKPDHEKASQALLQLEKQQLYD